MPWIVGPPFAIAKLVQITIWLVVKPPLWKILPFISLYWRAGGQHCDPPAPAISQLGWLFPIYGKIKNVPNHQPAIITIWFMIGTWWLIPRSSFLWVSSPWFFEWDFCGGKSSTYNQGYHPLTIRGMSHQVQLYLMESINQFTPIYN